MKAVKSGRIVVHMLEGRSFLAFSLKLISDASQKFEKICWLHCERSSVRNVLVGRVEKILFAQMLIEENLRSAFGKMKKLLLHEKRIL